MQKTFITNRGLKTEYHELLGSQVMISPADAVSHLERAVSEGIGIGNATHKHGSNIFGRSSAVATYGDLSFAAGMASTGLRTGAILNQQEWESQLNVLSGTARMQIPIVVFCLVNSRQWEQELGRTGAVVFSAITGQEALDLMIAGHRIAEQALIPVIVTMDAALAMTESSISFPAHQDLFDLTGNPDQFIPCPTPAQQMIFGKTRRRIPSWFSPDVPVMAGAPKGGHAAGLENAAREGFIYGHIDEIVHDVFSLFEKTTGRKLSATWQCGDADATHLVLCSGVISDPVKTVLERNFNSGSEKTMMIRLVQIHPFPGVLQQSTKNKKGITVIDPDPGALQQPHLFPSVGSYGVTESTPVYSALFNAIPSEESLTEMVRNMLPGGKRMLKFRMEAPVTKNDTQFPKHKVLLETIRREYPGLENRSVGQALDKVDSENRSNLVPMVIRRYKDKGPVYSRLSHFNDNTASMWEKYPGELVADPFQAVPVMPPASAGLHNGPVNRATLPVFDPSRCTGCGDCMVYCPHSALPSIAIGPESLFRSGISLASSKGAAISQLIPLVKNLCRIVSMKVNEQKETASKVGELYQMAFDELAAQMSLSHEKLDTAKAELNLVIEEINGFQASVTDVFFKSAEVRENGSGQWFSIVADANACTGCGICAELCKENALDMNDQKDGLLHDLEQRFSLWEALPDTPGDTVVRLVDDESYNPFSAVMLSRSFYYSMSGGIRDTGRSPAKGLIHLITSVTESVVQPRIKDAVSYLDEMLKEISNQIQVALSEGIPSGNIGALSKAVSGAAGSKITLDDLIKKTGHTSRLQPIDIGQLQVKLELSQDLTNLRSLMEEAPTGVGRARMGVLLDTGLDIGTEYPWNSFTSPVMMLDSEAAPAWALGLIQGHIRHNMDNIKVIRKGALVLKGKYNPSVHDTELASLQWADLTQRERSWIPPVLVVVKKYGNNAAGWIQLLESGLPVKMIWMDDAAPLPGETGAYFAQNTGSLLAALVSGKCSVSRSSLADPAHLFAALLSVAGTDLPGLLWLFTPDLDKQTPGTLNWPGINSMSCDTRAFQLFNFKKSKDEIPVASQTDLTGNPAKTNSWLESEVEYKVDEELKSFKYKLTWADWAFTLKAWRPEFHLYEGLKDDFTGIADFLDIPPASRSGKVPGIIRLNEQENLVRYAVSDEVVVATENCNKSWIALKEICGEHTEFPEKLKRQAEQELSVQFELQIEEIRAKHRSEIADLENEFMKKTQIKLREKLVWLAGQNKS